MIVAFGEVYCRRAEDDDEEEKVVFPFLDPDEDGDDRGEEQGEHEYGSVPLLTMVSSRWNFLLRFSRYRFSTTLWDARRFWCFSF